MIGKEPRGVLDRQLGFRAGPSKLYVQQICFPVSFSIRHPSKGLHHEGVSLD